MRGIVLQLSIDQFENESRRMATTGVPMTTTPHRVMLNDPARASSMFAVTASDVSIHRRVIAELLRPRDWKPPEDRAFFLRGKEVNELCSMVEVVLQQVRPVRFYSPKSQGRLRAARILEVVISC